MSAPRLLNLLNLGCGSRFHPAWVNADLASRHPEVMVCDLSCGLPFDDASMDAVYASHLLEGVPAEYRKRWTVNGPGGVVRMADEVRALVTFNELNLIGEWPMKGKFDAIFCRNVVIYFDEPTQERIWGRFAPILEPGGALYIGHSERVTGPAASKFETTGLTTYALKGASA